MSGIVWSSDNGRMCPKCGKGKDKCVCKKSDGNSAEKNLDGDSVRIFRDRKARKGKVVTVITGIPLQGKALKEFAKKLKQKCGSGGTIKEDVVEIQGDFLEKIMEILQKNGWNVKKVGG